MKRKLKRMFFLYILYSLHLIDTSSDATVIPLRDTRETSLVVHSYSSTHADTHSLMMLIIKVLFF